MYSKNFFVEQLYLFFGVLNSYYHSIVTTSVHWLIDSALGTWEESIKSVVREIFAIGVKLLDWIAQQLIYLVKGDKKYKYGGSDQQQDQGKSKEQSKHEHGRQQSQQSGDTDSWKKFWSGRQLSTFNALIEREWLGGINRAVKGEPFAKRSKRTQSMPSLNTVMTDQPRGVGGGGDSVWVESDMFAYASGWGILENLRKRGLVEDFRIGLELSITKVFEFVRKLLRWLFLLPRARDMDALMHSHTHRQLTRSMSADNLVLGSSAQEPRQRKIQQATGVLRSQSVQFHRNIKHQEQHSGKLSAYYQQSLSAADVIRQSGYPLEVHVVTTQDGYVIRMERIARKNSKKVAFLIHGVLDTSLAWVCNGVSGSQAFGAYDQGFDVWLGNTRNNPPHLHANYRKGRAYWNYQVDELGVCDIASQVKHIDIVKCRELEEVRASCSKQSSGQRHSSSSYLYNSLEWIVGKYSLDLPKFQLTHTTSSSPKPPSLDGGIKQQQQQQRSSFNSWFNWSQHGDSSEGGNNRAATPESLGRRSISYGPIWKKIQHNFLGATAKQNKQVVQSEEEEQEQEQLPQQQSQTLLEPEPNTTTRQTSNSPYPPTTPHSPLPATKEEKGVEEEDSSQPYTLHGIGHSLGAAAMLIYVIHMLRQKQPHHLNHLLLLTPAGIHREVPIFARVLMWILSPLEYLAHLLPPSALCIPTPLLRAFAFKLTIDLTDIPALGELFRTTIKTALSGDISDWDRALLMPHYGPTAMPTISLNQLCQLLSWAKTGRFHTRGVYDIVNQYNMLSMPVDLVAGRQDGIVSRKNVQYHFDKMESGGVNVTYKEFDYGHLDFTFAVKEELRDYVLERLRNACPT